MRIREKTSVVKHYLTLTGRVSFWRKVFIPATAQDKEQFRLLGYPPTIVPLDMALGIDKIPGKLSLALMLEIAYWAQNQGSYQEAEDEIRRTLKLEIGDDTIRKVTNLIGSIVFLHDQQRADTAYEQLEKPGTLDFPYNRKGVLYIEMDGAMFNTRGQDQNASTWRENKLGIVFSSDNVHFLGYDENGGERFYINRKEYADYIGSSHEFGKHLFAAALRNGYGKYQRTVIISDGATWIRNLTEEFFPDAQQILDLYHAIENIYSFAKYKFDNDEKLFVPWAKRMSALLKKSEYQQVIDEVACYKGKTIPGVVNLHTYLTNNIDNIDYKRFREEGLYFGSGAIESSNKSVLQRRLKQAGMRWDARTAQNMVTLRAKAVAGKWVGEVERYVPKFFEELDYLDLDSIQKLYK
ncbi:MAG: UPF0236 family protein [Candidatus Brocadiales bacterium]|nr:UPF0236 family protein [Candidatus Brocadiales bacterium]